MSYPVKILSAGMAALLAGCASMPTGPSVMVLPGSGQSFEQFQYDDGLCQQFALAQVGGASPNDAAIESGVASAAVGTALGAAAGAALGGGRGAVIGAGTGLVAGSMVGSSYANSSRYASQQHYDAAYIQCMYAKGHQVPVSGQVAPTPPRQMAPAYPSYPSYNVPPPSGSQIPPPPAGNPPAPPPQ